MINNLKIVPGLILLCVSNLAISGTMGSIKEDYNFYIEGDIGYTFSNWTIPFNYLFPLQTYSSSTNFSGGFTGGGDLGYKLNKYFSIELDAFDLPTVKYNVNSSTSTYTASDSGSVSNWLLGFSGKLTVPIAQISGLDIFGKFGVAYRAGTNKDNDILNVVGSGYGTQNIFVQPTSFSVVEPIFGGGLQYHLNEHWVINAQYLYAPPGIVSTTVLGPNEADHSSIPQIQIVTAGIGLYF